MALKNKRRRPKVQPHIREMVFKRDGYRCINCGSQHDLTMEHLVPLSRNGSNHSKNLATLCAPCNFLKADMTWDEFVDKYESALV